jgi:hypothetical protein
MVAPADTGLRRGFLLAKPPSTTPSRQPGDLTNNHNNNNNNSNVGADRSTPLQQQSQKQQQRQQQLQQKKRTTKSTPTPQWSGGLKSGFLVQKTLSSTSSTQPGGVTPHKTILSNHQESASSSSSSNIPKPSTTGIPKGFLLSTPQNHVADKKQTLSHQWSNHNLVVGSPARSSQDLLVLERPTDSSPHPTTRPITNSRPFSSSLLIVEEKGDESNMTATATTKTTTTTTSSSSSSSRNSQPAQSSIQKPSAHRPLISVIHDQPETSTVGGAPPTPRMVRPFISVLEDHHHPQQRKEMENNDHADITVAGGGTDMEPTVDDDARESLLHTMGPRIPQSPPGGSSSSSSVSFYQGGDHRVAPTSQSPHLTKQGAPQLGGGGSKGMEGFTREENVDDRSGTTFLAFQHKLLRMKWKEDGGEDNDVLSKDWNPQQVSWAWHWLLARPQPPQPHSSSIGRLSNRLLQYHPQSVGEFLSPETGDDRARSLQVIQRMQTFLWNEEIPMPFLGMETWVHQVLTRLVVLVDQSNHRSVLANEAWIASILLIHRLVGTLECKIEGKNRPFGTTTGLPINDLQETTEHLLRVQLRWKLEKKRQDARSEAWICLIQQWNEVSESYRLKSLTEKWQTLVTGCLMGDGRRWGGVRHLFCSDNSLDVPDMTMAWTTLRQGDDGTLSKSSDRGILLRGILAWLASIKRFGDSTGKDLFENLLAIFPTLRSRTECACAVLMW